MHDNFRTFVKDADGTVVVASESERRRRVEVVQPCQRLTETYREQAEEGEEEEGFAHHAEHNNLSRRNQSQLKVSVEEQMARRRGGGRH